jgi:iron complex outermembrane receptor protein
MKKDRRPSYAVLNLNNKYSFDFEKVKCNTKIGIENIFGTYYSTFSDWNNIPRKGRNFFLNLAFNY